MTDGALGELEARGQFGEDASAPRLAPSFMEKARHNLLFAAAALELGESPDAKRALRLPDSFSAHDWAVVASYYAMYHAALAALARVGYRSRSHAATILALEAFFVRRDLLEPEAVDLLQRARALEEEHIEGLRMAKRRRETAQYAVTRETGSRLAEAALSTARSFVNRMDALVHELGEPKRGGAPPRG